MNDVTSDSITNDVHEPVETPVREPIPGSDKVCIGVDLDGESVFVLAETSEQVAARINSRDKDAVCGLTVRVQAPPLKSALVEKMADGRWRLFCVVINGGSYDAVGFYIYLADFQRLCLEVWDYDKNGDDQGRIDAPFHAMLEIPFPEHGLVELPAGAVATQPTSQRGHHKIPAVYAATVRFVRNPFTFMPIPAFTARYPDDPQPATTLDEAVGAFHAAAQALDGGIQLAAESVRVSDAFGEPFGDVDVLVARQIHPDSSRFYRYIRELRRLFQDKSHDYGSEVSPLANLRASAEFGVAPWLAVMVRLNDKIARIKALASKGALRCEPIADSFRDIAVYAILAALLYEDEHPTPREDDYREDDYPKSTSET